jgi:hypothetical protein
LIGSKWVVIIVSVFVPTCNPNFSFMDVFRHSTNAKKIKNKHTLVTKNLDVRNIFCRLPICALVQMTSPADTPHDDRTQDKTWYYTKMPYTKIKYKKMLYLNTPFQS